MQKSNQDEFFELLLKNDEIELKNYLLRKGKQPKPVCPISFVSEENENDSNS